MSGLTSVEAPPASPVEIGIMVEKIRSNHEEIERLEQLVMEDLKIEETSPRKQLLQGHRLESMAKSIVLKSEKLVETYEKVKDDIAPLPFKSPSWADVSSAFSSRLQEILEYHQKHPFALEESAIASTGEKEDSHTESESGDGPLQRSTGWDGRPIPYWLVKLGLGQEYKCEICRNRSYAGKRAFERHFKEWRHKDGLYSLGIPYTDKLNGIASIEEAKEIRKRMPESQRLPLPLEAGGNLGPLLARSQLTDQGTEGSSSNQAPVGVAIPPPDIRSVVDKTVAILSETRLEIERKIVDVFGKVEGFEFLSSGDAYHGYYLDRLSQHRAGAGAAATRSGHGDSQTCLAAEFIAPSPRLEPHKFTCRLPEGITCKEVDIIKLTAQFWAMYGIDFWEEHCSESRNKDPEFEFMKMRGGGRFHLFSRLVEAYMGVVYSRPEILKENAPDMETVLENCYHRLQKDRSRKDRARQEKARQEKSSAKRAPRGHDLLGHLCVMAEMAIDPPPKPDPKRQKIDESDLVPEDQFLAHNATAGCARIWIYQPDVSGGLHFQIKVPSLSETVASLKEKIAQGVNIPISTQKLSGKVGILEDNKSLAHYNVGAQDVLTLIVEWRKLPVR
uniref:Putative splicing factor 3A subunit 1 n=1 Tax=Noccaea caerulescens TaxID=107243 RepID=A0A1J3E0C1_NOCCA